MRKPHPSQQDASGLMGLVRRVFAGAPTQATDWLKTGAALGVARTGARVAGSVIRRNPALAIAAAAVGVGALAYAAYRKRAQVDAATPAPSAAPPIDATATVVETRRRRAAPRA